MATSGKSKAFITLAIFTSALMFAGLSARVLRAAAQDQDQTSLGDAARKVRTEKKSEQPTKTFTNENLPKTDVGVSVVGPSAPPVPATPPAATDDKTGDKPATTPAIAPANPPMSGPQLALQHEMDEAVKQKDQLEKEIDLAQRDYSLQEQQALQNPRFNTDRDAQAHLADVHQGIDDQKAELDKIKAHIADVQKKLDDLNKGGEPGSK